MASAASTQHVLLSPAELAYLHSTLSLSPPIRPDGRTPTQFRPLTAETAILPGANGSARICFADGTEAVVGVKAEVAKTRQRHGGGAGPAGDEQQQQQQQLEGADAGAAGRVYGEAEWVEMTVEIPGLRDDDANTVFLAELLSEALLADGEFAKKLWINSRFHWKLYLDVILISPPLSYPLPLLSLTIHLALLATRLPRLKSEGDEDPLFDDDWEASPFLYSEENRGGRPPVTLLVTAVGDNIIFDPSKEELAVADVAVAISLAEAPATRRSEKMAVGSARDLRLLSIRVIDPPSRLTPSGSSDTAAVAADGSSTDTKSGPDSRPETRIADSEAVEGVWKAPRGGTRVAVLSAIIQKVLERGGVADEVMEALDAVELG
ncbi:hypothetical protein RB595_004465 [Gaeumannomyces hyphopodioides]